MEKVKLTKIQAISLLPKRKEIHTFRNSPIALIGVDWNKKDLVKAIEEFEETLELTGETARNMDHGLALFDGMGSLFIETDKKKLDKFDPQ